MQDGQGSDELRVFRLFAESAGLSIPKDSIQKREPPEPDICCEVPGYGQTSFELVETIDPRLAQSVAAQIRLQESLRERASEVLDGFGDALVFVRYVRDTLIKQRVRAVERLLDYLGTLPSGFKGDHVVPPGAPLSSLVRAVRVTRGTFVGPVFQVEGGGFISDPIIECIERKFTKAYQVPHRLELLVFYELQSTPMAKMRVPEVEAFVMNRLPGSQFARVWVFDVENRSILFSSDRAETKEEHAV